MSNKRSPAAKAEATAATDEGREFTFAGNTYKLPPPGDYSIETVEAVEEQRWISAVKHLLGPAQWRLYKSRHPKAKEAFDFIEAMFAEDGVDPGES